MMSQLTRLGSKSLLLAIMVANLKKKGRTMRCIKIAKIDVRTCHDDMKLVDIVKAASQLKLDVIAMQETRCTNSWSFHI